MLGIIVRNFDESMIDALKTQPLADHGSTAAEHGVISAEVLMQSKGKAFAEALVNIYDVGADADLFNNAR
jgi:plasmid stability protein